MLIVSYAIRSEENLFTNIPAYKMFESLFDWSFLISAAASSGVFNWCTENMIMVTRDCTERITFRVDPRLGK